MDHTISDNRLYPVKKYEQERKSILHKVKNLLSQKKLPTDRISNNNSICLECIELEKNLSGKHLKDTSKEYQKLFLGDIYFLSDSAFNYYIFELIEIALEDKPIFESNIFLQQLLKNNIRFENFNKEEKDIIMSLLTNLLAEINEVAGYVETVPKLESWEKEEIYHPFNYWKNDIEESLLLLCCPARNDVLPETTEAPPR